MQLTNYSQLMCFAHELHTVCLFSDWVTMGLDHLPYLKFILLLQESYGCCVTNSSRSCRLPVYQDGETR